MTTAKALDRRLAFESPSSAPSGTMRKHAATALMLALFVAIFDTLLNLGIASAPNERDFGLEALGYNLVIVTSFVLSLFAAALVAERATARGVRYGIAWSVAVVVGCLSASALQWLVLTYVFDWSVFASHDVLMAGRNREEWTSRQPAWVLLNLSIPATLATLLYGHWRRAAQVGSRLYAAEVGRAETERRVLEARLQATQARVEPQFLFDTLAKLKSIHVSDPARAIAQLDSLIAYLRAALPHLHDTRSTLAQELDLCRAYLDIEQCARSTPSAFSIEAPEALATASVPAMVLLPLVIHAVGCADASRGPSVSLRADFHRDRLRVTLKYSAPQSDATAPRDVLERLHALYGERARLNTDRATDGFTRVVLEIPFGGANEG